MSGEDNTPQNPPKRDPIGAALPPVDKHYAFVLAIIVIIGF
jgi:hypothetical protein